MHVHDLAAAAPLGAVPDESDCDCSLCSSSTNMHTVYGWLSTPMVTQWRKSKKEREVCVSGNAHSVYHDVSVQVEASPCAMPCLPLSLVA
jgi:hypothetical protein